MEAERLRGVAVSFFGLILLTGGVLVLVFVPSWGRQIAAYPAQIAGLTFPTEAAPMVAGITAMIGPLLEQIGGYIQAVGYFIGSLLTLIALGVTSIGAILARG
jgi:hypothetical protein